MAQMFGKNNPQWKGDKVGYGSIHEYVRNRKKKPSLCERCNKVPPRDLANISGKYKRDLSDWEWLCRKCHMDGDGRNDKLRESGKSRRIPDKKCLVCGKMFHRDSSMNIAKYCSIPCRSLMKVGRRKPLVEKICVFCSKKFIPKNSSITSCSRYCGAIIGWQTRKK